MNIVSAEHFAATFNAAEGEQNTVRGTNKKMAMLIRYNTEHDQKRWSIYERKVIVTINLPFGSDFDYGSKHKNGFLLPVTELLSHVGKNVASRIKKITEPETILIGAAHRSVVLRLRIPKITCSFSDRVQALVCERAKQALKEAIDDTEELNFFARSLITPALEVEENFSISDEELLSCLSEDGKNIVLSEDITNRYIERCSAQNLMLNLRESFPAINWEAEKNVLSLFYTKLSKIKVSLQ